MVVETTEKTTKKMASGQDAGYNLPARQPSKSKPTSGMKFASTEKKQHWKHQSNHQLQGNQEGYLHHRGRMLMRVLASTSPIPYTPTTWQQAEKDAKGQACHLHDRWSRRGGAGTICRLSTDVVQKRYEGNWWRCKIPLGDASSEVDNACRCQLCHCLSWSSHPNWWSSFAEKAMNMLHWMARRTLI